MIERARSAFDCEQASVDKQRDARILGDLKSCYIELLGEKHPKVVRGVIPDEEEKEPATMPIHEYSWNVGITGNKLNWYDYLDANDALVVQLIFHVSHSRHTIHEVAANLMQVPPYQKTTTEAILDWMDLMKPLAETAGKALEAAGAGAPGKVISAVAGMKLNAVPVTKFRWYVKTFTMGEEAGIEWHIPKALLEFTGNRIVGSLGVTFLDCGAPPQASEKPDELPLEIRAFLRLRDGLTLEYTAPNFADSEIFLNEVNNPTRLLLEPV